ncbi:complement factor B-like [Mercenaria mercenaria]|uniref:complement factor B-like n=1 Tax=Mercenaria mercenaria TaxID=6596 RepID=UPI00234E6754|nr:complement factor B-like [Mercenaria mercenaria]
MEPIKGSALTCFVFGITFLGLCTIETTKAEVRKKYGCVLPDEPWYGSFIFNDRKKSLKYKCDEGYLLTGGYRQKERKCRRGKWSGKDRDCLNLDFSRSKCPVLRSPNNGEVIVEGRKVGDKAHFRCDEGFVLEGSDTVTCQRGRRWDGTMPVCSSRRTVEDFANHLKDKMIDSLAGATTGSETGAQSRLSPGKSGLDIVLVVDTSSSIGDKSLSSAKKFMKLLVDIFGVSDQPTGGKNGTRFALVSFSGEANIVFNLDDRSARSKEAVKESIDAIQNTGGGTDFRKALLKVSSEIFMTKIRFAADESRLKHATRAVFLITDAEVTSDLASNRVERIKSAADNLKIAAGFEVFAIGVGQKIDKFVLSEIASTPHIEHVFLLAQFKDLEKVGDIIAERNIDYGQCGISGKTEIAQGSQKAAKGAWPWLGWLSVVSEGMLPRTCGGAIVCDRWFLTAASCVSKVEDNVVIPFNASQINVFLSDFDIYKKDKEEIWPVVKSVSIHDNYTGEEIKPFGIRENDIALLDLGENATERPVFNKFLRPICFPTDNVTLGTADAQFEAMLAFPHSYDAYTAGWGNAPDNAKYMDIQSSEMRQNRRPVQKRKVCRGRYDGLDLDRFFCVGDEFQESSSCMGDVGGPYMVQLPNKRYYSLGLALNTRNCDTRYQFSIFLNLLHPTVSEWVASILDGCNRVEELDK